MKTNIQGRMPSKSNILLLGSRQTLTNNRSSSIIKAFQGSNYECTLAAISKNDITLQFNRANKTPEGNSNAVFFESQPSDSVLSLVSFSDVIDTIHLYSVAVIYSLDSDSLNLAFDAINDVRALGSKVYWIHDVSHLTTENNGNTDSESKIKPLHKYIKCPDLITTKNEEQKTAIAVVHQYTRSIEVLGPWPSS